MKQWVIINLSRTLNSRIPEGSRPTYLHDDKDKAESELLRLQARNPAHYFTLFESVATARPVTVTAYHLEPVMEDDDIPF